MLKLRSDKKDQRIMTALQELGEYWHVAEAVIRNIIGETP